MQRALVAAAAAAALLLPRAGALDNGFRTPAMGWSSWYGFTNNINEALLRDIADGLVSSGLRDHGFRLLAIDDGWALPRMANGTVTVDPAVFPSGIAAFVDYVHARGLLFGIYTSVGPLTCLAYQPTQPKRPGSCGYEALDAATYAAWGVDSVKNDGCGSCPGEPYVAMRDALNATGRRMYYEIHAGTTPGSPNGTVANDWRTGDDLYSSSFAMWTNRLDLATAPAQAALAGPGSFPNPDFLEVGYSPRAPKGAAGVMSALEQRSMFTMWAALPTALILSADVRAGAPDGGVIIIFVVGSGGFVVSFVVVVVVVVVAAVAAGSGGGATRSAARGRVIDKVDVIIVDAGGGSGSHLGRFYGRRRTGARRRRRRRRAGARDATRVLHERALPQHIQLGPGLVLAHRASVIEMANYSIEKKKAMRKQFKEFEAALKSFDLTGGDSALRVLVLLLAYHASVGPTVGDVAAAATTRLGSVSARFVAATALAYMKEIVAGNVSKEKESPFRKWASIVGHFSSRAALKTEKQLEATRKTTSVRRASKKGERTLCKKCLKNVATMDFKKHDEHCGSGLSQNDAADVKAGRPLGTSKAKQAAARRAGRAAAKAAKVTSVKAPKPAAASGAGAGASASRKRAAKAAVKRKTAAGGK